MDQWSYPHTPGQPRDEARPASARPASVRPEGVPRLRGHLPESEYRYLFKKVDWGVAILEAAANGDDFVFVDINPTLERTSHLQRDFLLGQSLTGAFPASARVGLLERMRRTWKSGEAEQGPDETEIALHAKTLGPYQIQRLPSGRLAIIFYGRNARPQQDVQVQELGFFDPLTKLPNRQLLLDRLQQALAASQRSRQYGALIFIDLDNFKTLNDTRGHDVGDKLLVEVARRLQISVREVDTVARFGGDEFVVLLKSLSASSEKAGSECEDVAVKILANLNQPYLLAGQDYWCSASLGITLFEDKAIGPDELLKRADIAMYQAKAAGRNNLRFFDPAMQAAVHERAMLEAELRRAIERRELKLRYQPQVDAGGRLIGVEALVYWQHPSRGILYARDFIPLAEETGLIQQVGQQVLRLACNQLVDWRHYSAMARLPLSVNISNRQFRQANFVAQVRAVLESTGADPRLLRLEMTEDMIFQNFEDTRAKMKALQAIGVSFSLDDYGTGFSSLAQFKQLRLDQVKLDQSFVQNFGIDAGDAAVARSVIAMGTMFGIPVVAEGVETAAQRDFLLSQGCGGLQGYFFGAPVPHETFMATYA